MKKILILIILSMLLNIMPVYAADIEKYTESANLVSVNKMYSRIKASDWNKHFKLQAKAIKMCWKKNKKIFKNKIYETSYARVQLVVNKNGEILAYKIKSSCVPVGDKEYIKHVEKTIAECKKIEALPPDFYYDYIIFTVKFHTKLPKNINKNNIDWGKYGIADVEISKGKTKIILK